MDFRLSYGDCDPAGIVYYAAYYPWFERTYNEWTFGGNHTPESMPELWGATHISRASGCEYFVPGMLFDPLRCEMRLGKIGTTSFTVVFDVVHRDREELIARGHIVFVFTDMDRTPTPVPDGLLDALRAAGVEL
jgi:YbgC/YbaW family acyl-CoA thioester hydrolase